MEIFGADAAGAIAAGYPSAAFPSPSTALAAVRSLLIALNAGPLLAAVERAVGGDPARYRYFAVSALGNSPVGQRQHTRGIAPFRCLDPLRWVLAGTGVVA